MGRMKKKRRNEDVKQREEEEEGLYLEIEKKERKIRKRNE